MAKQNGKYGNVFYGQFFTYRHVCYGCLKVSEFDQEFISEVKDH